MTATWPTTALTMPKVRTYTVCWRCGQDVAPSYGEPRECRDCYSVRVYVDKCGSYAGYQRHKRAGEYGCEPCRAANAAHRRERTERERAAS